MITKEQLENSSPAGKYELVFENDTRRIESIDVLIDYVNNKNLN